MSMVDFSVLEVSTGASRVIKLLNSIGLILNLEPLTLNPKP